MSSKLHKSYSKNWCILPWVHAASLTDGSIQLCCVCNKSSGQNLKSSHFKEYQNSDYLKKVRRQMLKGDVVAECAHCLAEEMAGHRSHRQIEINHWKRLIGEDKIREVVAATQADGAISSPLYSLDLRLGHICNFECIMCSPRESSRWKELEYKLSHQKWGIFSKLFHARKMGGIAQDQWVKRESFWNDLRLLLPELREVILGGGEPLLVSKVTEFVKWCADSGHASHIRLRIHTNGSIFPEGMIESFKSFEDVEIFVSLDGIGEQNRYIRYPADWQKIVSNLKAFDSLGDNICMRFLYSVQALNIRELPRFHQWVKEMGFRKMNAGALQRTFIHPGLVHWPHFLNCKILPSEMKKEISQYLDSYFSTLEPGEAAPFKGIIDYMNSEDWSARLPQFLSYCERLDKIRGTDLLSCFPSMEKLK